MSKLGLLLDMEAGRLPGLSLTLLQRGAILRRVALGSADRLGHRPVTDDTLFGAGSMTKLVTALVLGRLHDRGLLDLDQDPARRWPWLARAGRPLGFLDLLGHRSGLARGPYGYEHGLTATRHGLVEDGAPAGVTKYSNLAFAVLQHLVEAAADAPFEAVAAREVLEPLGLDARWRARATDRAEGSQGGPQVWDPVRPGAPLHPARDLGLPLAASGLWCTSAALARLAWELARTTPGGLLRRSTRRRLAAGAPPDAPWSPVFFRGRIGSLPCLRHRGSFAGMTATLIALPEADLVGVAMTNLESAGDPLSRVLARAVRGAPGVSRSGHVDPEADAPPARTTVDRGSFVSPTAPSLRLEATAEGTRIRCEAGGADVGGEALTPVRVGRDLLAVPAQGSRWREQAFWSIRRQPNGSIAWIRRGDDLWTPATAALPRSTPPRLHAICGHYAADDFRSLRLIAHGASVVVAFAPGLEALLAEDSRGTLRMLDGPFAHEAVVAETGPGGAVVAVRLGGHRFVPRQPIRRRTCRPPQPSRRESDEIPRHHEAH